MWQARALVVLLATFLSLAAGSGRAAIENLVVTTAGSYTRGLSQPGGLSVAFCTGLTGIRGIVVTDSFPLPFQLAGIAVKVSGASAPILAVADFGRYQQVNFQVPREGLSGPPVVEVSQAGQAAIAATEFVAFPADFFRDGSGFGILQHAADYSLITPSHPALGGEFVIAYATGLGAVYPPVPTGYPAPSVPLSTLSYLDREERAVLLNGQATEVLYAGLTPGLVGVYQINFRIPETVSSGDATLAFRRTYCIAPFSQCGGGLTRGTMVTDTSAEIKVPIR